jgi:signal transduction histidine kinase
VIGPPISHGLKTPLALGASVERLHDKVMSNSPEIDEQTEKMRRHAQRELARARVRHGGAITHANIATCIDAIIRTLEHTPDGERIEFEQSVPVDMTLAVDPDDLNEILGNLLENATRHARTLVRIGATFSAGRILISVDDDGEGLSDESRAKAMLRGVRLDSTGSGAGLGLAIAQDIVVTYGGQLELSTSPLGGLQASVELPANAG